MDPLSISASVVGFLAFSGISAKNFRRLINDARKAPNELLALSDEISGLNLIVSDIQKTLRNIEETAGNVIELPPTFVQAVEEQLRYAKIKLLALDDILAKVYSKGIDGSQVFVRYKWLRHKPAVQAILQDVSGLKSSLNVLMSSFSAQYSFSTNMLISSRSSHTNAQLVLDSHHSELNRPLTASPAGVDSALGGIVPRSPESGFIRTYSVQALGDQPTTMTALTQTLHQIGQFATITLQLKRIVRCAGYCPCICHQRSELVSPSSFKHVLGKLSITYAGLPILSSQCSVAHCINQYSRAMQLSYSFPPWLLRKTIEVVCAMTQMSEPCFGLKMKNRTAEGGNTIFHMAREGDTAGIVDLFKQHRASPNDISFRLGYTAIHFALELGHIDTIELLLNSGVDVYANNDEDSCDVLVVSERILSPRKRNYTETAALNRIFAKLGASHEELWDFTLLHRIVVRDLQINLTEALRNPDRISELNRRDRAGRTPLFWAAMRGDAFDTQLLIDAGSSIFIEDSKGTSLLAAAVQSGSRPTVKILLNAGANIHDRDRRGHTILQMASWTIDDPEFLEELVLAGACLDGQNHRRNTPLQSATCLNHYQNGKFLIDWGANLENRDSDGDTPISEALRFDCYEMMKLLLDNGARVDQVNNAGETLLHIAATFGTKRCLKLLSQYNLAGLRHEALDNKGRTAYDHFQEKFIKPIGVRLAFEELLAHLKDTVESDEDEFYDANLY